MIISSSGKIIAGSRILINETINEFLGTVDNQWSNPENWSLGLVPTANHVAVIKADCVNAEGLVKALMVNPNIELSLLNYSVFSTDKLFNLGTILRDTGNGNNVSINAVSNTTVFGLFNVAPNSGLTIVSVEPIFDLTSQINNNSELSFVNLIGNIGIRGIIANITNIIQLQTSTTVNVLDNLTIDTIGGSGVGSTIRLANGVKLEANNVFTDGNSSGILCEGDNEIIIKNNYTVGYGYQIPITVPVIFKDNNSTLKISNQNVPPYIHNIIVDDVTVVSTNNYGNICTIFNSRLNGTTPSSEFILETGHVLHFLGNTDSNVEELMSVGILTLQTDSILNYALAGNQFINPVSYGQLGIIASGVKSLKGNTQCNHLYFSDTATLDLNGHTISGYTKYTDNGNIPRTIPSGFISEVNLIAQYGGAKTLTGNLTCDVMNCTPAGSGNTYIEYNGFTITATIFNDIFNSLTHVGGIRDNMNWADIGSNSITLASPITIKGRLLVSVSRINLELIGGVTMADNSTYKLYEGGIDTSLPLGISSYYNLDLLPMYVYASFAVTLRQDVIVRGTFTKPDYCTLNKNGFTIKDSNGNDLE